MATRVTDGARRERALLPLNLKKKRDCSQSNRARDLSVRTDVKHAYFGSNMIAVVLFTFTLSIKIDNVN